MADIYNANNVLVGFYYEGRGDVYDSNYNLVGYAYAGTGEVYDAKHDYVGRACLRNIYGEVYDAYNNYVGIAYGGVEGKTYDSQGDLVATIWGCEDPIVAGAAYLLLLR